MNLNETNQYGCVFFPVVIAGEEQTVSWVRSGLEFCQADIKNEAGGKTVDDNDAKNNYRGGRGSQIRERREGKQSREGAGEVAGECDSPA